MHFCHHLSKQPLFSFYSHRRKVEKSPQFMVSKRSPPPISSTNLWNCKIIRLNNLNIFHSAVVHSVHLIVFLWGIEYFSTPPNNAAAVSAKAFSKSDSAVRTKAKNIAESHCFTARTENFSDVISNSVFYFLYLAPQQWCSQGVDNFSPIWL